MDGYTRYRQTFLTCLQSPLFFGGPKKDIPGWEYRQTWRILLLQCACNLQSTPAVQSQQLISETFRETSCSLILISIVRWYIWSQTNRDHLTNDCVAFLISMMTLNGSRFHLSRWAHCSISYLWLALNIQPGGLQLQTLGWSCNISGNILFEYRYNMDLISN